MFGLKKSHKGEAPLVLPVLKKLSARKNPVRMEIGSAAVFFKTCIMLRDDVVLVGKPPGISDFLRKDRAVRFRIPWDRQHEVRMEIAVLHLNLNNGTEAFICKAPSGRAFPARRHNERFGTQRFNNVHLELPALGEEFPILDLSDSGCRVRDDPGLVAESFKVSRRVWEGTIRVGTGLRVSLATVIPRSYQENSVGFQFAVGRSEKHEGRLKTLLGALAIFEMQTPNVEPV